MISVKDGEAVVIYTHSSPSMCGERMRQTERGRDDQEQRKFREVGETEKYTCFGGDCSVRACHRQPVCRCYNVQKVPVTHDLKQLDCGCQGSPWSGQVGERQI